MLLPFLMFDKHLLENTSFGRINMLKKKQIVSVRHRKEMKQAQKKKEKKEMK